MTKEELAEKCEKEHAERIKRLINWGWKRKEAESFSASLKRTHYIIRKTLIEAGLASIS